MRQFLENWGHHLAPFSQLGIGVPSWNQLFERIAHQITQIPLKNELFLFIMKAAKNLTATKTQDKSIILTPQENHQQTLIWMHGLGDTADGGFLEVFQAGLFTKNNTKVILLQAPIRRVTINMGMEMPSWYDIRRFASDPKEFDKAVSIEEVQQSAKTILSYIEQEEKAITSERIFLGGFSQGCSMALHVGLGYGKKLGGIIGLSGFLFPITQMNAAQSTTPIFLAHGKDDMLIPFAWSMESYKRLDNSKREKFKLLHLDSVGHSTSMQELQEMKQFLDSI